jgi:hypothetical protein
MTALRPGLVRGAAPIGDHNAHYAVSHLIEGCGSWKAFIALVFFVLLTILLGWSALAALEGR